MYRTTPLEDLVGSDKSSREILSFLLGFGYVD